jgi:hypothetical protein
MADPADVLSAWQDAIRQVGGVAASLASGPAGVVDDLLPPLQHQAELLEQILQHQLEFERELAGRAIAPARAALELVQQATGTFRAQATAYRSASAVFGQLADLMEQQAQIVERAGAAIRAPVAALRSTPGAAHGGTDSGRDSEH